MRFEVLGPLRMVGGDGPVPIRSAKQRVLLAALLTRAGEAVPVDVITHAMWGGDGRTASDDTLRWHVHQLRRTLDDPARLTWESGGYRLAAEDDEIDARRFEGLYRRGTSAAERNDANSASELLTAALALWRGDDAYPDLADAGGLREEGLRLDGLRLDAITRRIDADLDIGREDALISELTALIAHYPLHERFRAQLMRALYRTGRRADALQVYRDSRAVLVEELGLEPGPELRAVEAAILAGDPDLDGPGTVRISVSTTDGPAELPAATPSFTGRGADAARLIELVTHPGVNVAAIAGPGGIGKSALALHVAHRVAEHFPDGQLYVNLHGATPDVKALAPEEVLGRFLRSLKVEVPSTVADVDELAGRFRSATAGRRLLILLDDARDAAQVRPLLPGSPSCTVLITGRRMLSTLDGAALHGLDMLGEGESIELLSRLAGAERVAAEPEEAARISRWCGGLPLALCIAAARLRTRPEWRIAELAERLDAEYRRLGELEIDDLAVRSSVTVSLRELAADLGGARAANLFRRLGLVDIPEVTVPVAAVLADLPRRTAEDLLETLVDAQLLEAHAPGRYRLHDLLRLYAKELAAVEEAPDERAAAVGRVLLYYAASTGNVLRAYEPLAAVRYEQAPTAPGADAPEGRDAAMAWILGEAANLRAITRQAASSPSTSDREAAIVVQAMLKIPLFDGGTWAMMLDLCESAARAADGITDTVLRGTAYRDIGELLSNLKRPEEALPYLEKAIDVAREGGDPAKLAASLAILGKARRGLGDDDGAMKCFTESLDLARRHGKRQSRVATLMEIGFLHSRFGRADEALAAQEEAATAALDLGIPYGVAITAGTVGSLYLKAGRFDEAAERFRHAIAKNREAGQSGSIMDADFVWGLGEARYGLGDRDGARDAWREALSILVVADAIDDAERAAVEAAENPEPPAAIRLRRGAD